MPCCGNGLVLVTQGYYTPLLHRAEADLRLRV